MMFLPVDSGALLIGDPAYLLAAGERTGIEREDMRRAIREAVKCGEVVCFRVGEGDLTLRAEPDGIEIKLDKEMHAPEIDPYRE